MLRKFLVAGFALVLGTVLAALWWRIDGDRMPEFDYPESRQVPEPNAFDFLVEAAEAIPDHGKSIADAVSGTRDPETGEWRDPTLDQVRSAVEENRQALALIREGLQHPFHYPQLHRVLLGEGDYHFGAFRMAARLLTLEARLHAADERFDRAMESVLDCLELGRKIGTRSPFSGALTGIANHGIGAHDAPAIVPNLRQTELLDAIERLESLGEVPLEMAGIFASERVHGLKYLESIFSKSDWRLRLAESEQMYLDDSWYGRAEFTLWQRLQMRLRAWKYHQGKIVRTVDEMTSAVGEILEEPFSDREGRFPTPGRPLPPSLGENFIEAVPKVWFSVLVAQTTHEGLLATLALEAWRKKHGEYPERLEDLEPNLLSSVPRDPFALDQALRYRREDDTYLLYSIGPNGQDNGGEAMERPDEEDPIRRKVPRTDLPGDLVVGINLLRPPDE